MHKKNPPVNPKPAAKRGATPATAAASHVPKLSTSNQPLTPPVHTSNKFYVLNELSAELLLKGADLSDHAMTESRPVGDTELNAANVGIESDDLSMGSDDETCDFGITDGQKSAIKESLLKFGAVRSEDQENWEQGEWAYFQQQCKSLNLNPDFTIEDVQEDGSGTAKFLAGQAGIGLNGNARVLGNSSHKSD
ncbi:hypothetical protein Hanom_Chr02g00095201 [Helianthus anomalus]